MKEIEKIHRDELKMLTELERISQKYNIKYYLAYGSALGAVRHKGFIPWDTDLDIIVEIDDYNKMKDKLNDELDSSFILKDNESTDNPEIFLSRIINKHDHGLKIHVDIFPMVGLPKNKWKQYIFRKCSRIIHRIYFIKHVDSKLHYSHMRTKKTIANILKIFTMIIPSKLLLYASKKMLYMYPIKESDFLYNISGSYGSKEVIEKEWLNQPKYVTFERSKFPIPEKYDKYLSHIYGDYMTPKKENYV